MGMPHYPAPPAPEPPVRRRRNTVAVVVSVVAALVVVLGIGAFFVLRGVAHNKAAGADEPPPRGLTTLPAHCADFLPSTVVAQALPKAVPPRDQDGMALANDVVRRCTWGYWDDDAGISRSLDLEVHAVMNPALDEPEPLPTAAADDVKAMDPGKHPHRTAMPGAEEAYVGDAEHTSPAVPEVDSLRQELLARYENVVVHVVYEPGAVPDQATMTSVLTTVTTETLKAVRRAESTRSTR